MGREASNRRDILVNFRVSRAEKSAWEAEAKRRDVPLSQLIRHIVKEYFDRGKLRSKGR